MLTTRNRVASSMAVNDKSAYALFPSGERTSHRVVQSGLEPVEVHLVVLGRDGISSVKQGQRDDDGSSLVRGRRDSAVEDRG